MKIKIIDLLNKIAKGEEVPERIKFDGKEYFFHKDSRRYYGLNGYSFVLCDYEMKKEVEIIEEDKKIEKLEPLQKEWMSLDDIKFTFSNSEMIIVNKINEIIDKLNEGDK